jgi:hypothetical protein
MLKLLAVLVLALCSGCEIRQSEEDIMADEYVRLNREVPLKHNVSMILMPRGTVGFYDDAPISRIVIINRGIYENLRTLRHEWEHARQKDSGEPYNEDKAYAAEDGDR